MEYNILWWSQLENTYCKWNSMRGIYRKTGYKRTRNCGDHRDSHRDKEPPKKGSAWFSMVHLVVEFFCLNFFISSFLYTYKRESANFAKESKENSAKEDERSYHPLCSTKYKKKFEFTGHSLRSSKKRR